MYHLRNFFLLIVLWSVAGVFFCTKSIAQPRVTKAQKIDKLMHEVYQKGVFNGSVLVAEKGKIIYQKSFGYANAETKEKLVKEAVFNIGSVSKTFTAMAITMLKQKGKLSYDDPVQKYWPKLAYAGITLRHLLSHTSGLPEYMKFFKKLWKDKSKIATNRDVLNILVKDKPKATHKPGERWKYCNTGYVLLALVVEKVSGVNFPEFLQQNIFKPLQMNHTTVNTRYLNQKITNLARGHVFDVNKRQLTLPKGAQYAEDHCLEGTYGDGGVYSTSTDLFRWDQALYTSRLVPQKALAEAFTPFTFNNGKKSNYGLGWFSAASPKVGKIVYHNGLWTGYRTRFFRYVDKDKTIIVTGNAHLHYVPVIRQTLARIVFEVPYATPKISVADKLLALDGKLTYKELMTRFEGLLKNKEKMEFNDMEINRAAYLMWQAGNYTKAFDIMKLNLVAYPNNPMVYQTLGYSYWERDDHLNARKYYQQAMKIMEKEPKKYKADIAWVQGQMKKLSK